MSLHTRKLLIPLLWWFFITITFSSSPVSCILTGTKQAILCLESERQALLTFKGGLRDEAGLLSSWSDDNPNCCNWRGVSCSNHTGHVLKLNLRIPFQFDDPEDKYRRFRLNTQVLEGEVRSSLLELKYLEYLDLSLNHFNSSKFPDFLSSLENLRYLNLSSSYFSGIIPPHLGNLSSLQYLDLGGNNGLEVESLQWLKGLSSLKHLNLDGVNLEKAGADWLKAFNMLPSLLELHLSGCGLSSLPSLINQSLNLTSLSILDLSQNNFKSSLTMPPWLFNLTSLVNFRCSECSLQSFILNEIGKLVKLQQVDLSGNGLRGPLPASLGNLSNLVMLNLEDNRLIGTLPRSLGSLVKLVSLDLSLNSFWGSIPTTIGSLTSLKTLRLADNQMNGTIAGSIGQLSELEELHLSGNPWQGLLTETHFEKHAKLQSLLITTTTSKMWSVMQSLLIRTTTSKVGSLVMNVTQHWLPPFRTSLRELGLDGAKMWSREFPRWTQTLRQLEILSLRDCGISDSIPAEFWKGFPNITALYLSNNAINIRTSFEILERQLPLVSVGKLQRLELANNSFSNGGGGGGEIPSNIDRVAPSLVYLDLSSNSISGEIPRSICQLPYLHYLFLNNNSLTGELTYHSWEKMKLLMTLDVSNNRLVGEIPESLGSLTYLSVLLFSDNNLQGEIPTFINCTKLQVLDFGENKLTGNIPPSLAERNTMLLLLRLRGNILSGTIPPEFCLLSRLQTLDLAHNNLQGIIPHCLGNLSLSNDDTVDYYYLADGVALVSKGREYTYGSIILKLVHLLDISGNNLSGNIPGSLMNLTAMRTLNLSMNRLTGDIPSNIGLLQTLESLDLSQNLLSGPIPQSLSSISSLSYLNLSHNNLYGRIPSSRQLQTLDESSSYDHNPLLCGLPLPTKCPGDGTPKDRQGEGEGEEEVEDSRRRFDLLGWGFILSLVLGFFVGFWGVCGSLVLKASWREAYFGYLADVKDKIIAIVVVNVARLQRKMGDIRMTT